MVEIGSNEVKVKIQGNDVIHVYETVDVYKLVYADGRVEKFEINGKQNMDRYRHINLNAFSFDVFSPLQNNINVC